jgi:hypothetical protein
LPTTLIVRGSVAAIPRRKTPRGGKLNRSEAPDRVAIGPQGPNAIQN